MADRSSAVKAMRDMADSSHGCNSCSAIVLRRRKLRASVSSYAAASITKDDLSLLGGMAEKEIKKYAKRGVFTVTQLSFTFRARRGRPPGQQKQVHQHALQALAIREKKVHVLDTPELPTSPIRIYFDIEGDPSRGFDYLLGLDVVADGV